MIIKSMSWKEGDFLQLLTYINKAKEKENTAIFHNLRTDPDDIAIIAQEFRENARYSPKRKNGVMCYHEILSLPGKMLPDAFSPTMLEDLAREYLWLRAPNALGYAKLHLDTDHPHIHLCISANQIKQKAKNRLSRAAFSQVKERLKMYCREKYPALTPLLSPNPKKSKKNRADSHQKQPHGHTIKADLAENILSVFATANHPADALSMLSASGIKMYQRGKDAFYGVTYQKKKYRLTTLGIKDNVKARIATWERTDQRLRELEAIEQAKEKRREISRNL